MNATINQPICTLTYVDVTGLSLLNLAYKSPTFYQTIAYTISDPVCGPVKIAIVENYIYILFDQTSSELSITTSSLATIGNHIATLSASFVNYPGSTFNLTINATINPPNCGLTYVNAENLSSLILPFYADF